MEDTRDYLLRIPEFAREKHSLSEAEEFLRDLGCSFPGKVIHVAGTNGKGSVCAFLSSILTASGYHVGTFTSPHLTDIRERICLDGEPIEEKTFQDSFKRVRAVWEKWKGKGRSHPTFFEYLFYMAAVCFDRKQPDFVILEAGMGGRRDVTNVCRPSVCVITSISLDHMAYLGDTVEEIAGEKAGIIKAGVPVVFDGNDRTAAAVIRKAAGEMKADCTDVRDLGLSVKWKGAFPEISMDFCGSRMTALLPFPAGYQVWNGAAAVKAAELLGGEIRAQSVSEGLSRARHAGRMEEVRPGFYLDGAHNRDGIRAFCQAASRIASCSGKKVRLLFSAVSDKEYGRMAEEILEELKPEEIFLAHMESDRGLSAAELTGAFKGASCPVRCFSAVREALACALTSRGEGLLFAAGSLYFVGELKECLKEERI